MMPSLTVKAKHLCNFSFAGTGDPLGKRLNNSKTRQEVGWEPKYSSFGHFLETL